MLEIYVDGSAINNENPNKPTLGGVGMVVIGLYPDSAVKHGEVHGFHFTVANDKLVDLNDRILDLGKTTNNTTELAAIYLALDFFERSKHVLKHGRLTLPTKIYGDSQYAGNLVFGNWKPK